MTMEESTLEERIVELESRLAFQDHTVEELNEVIFSQQQQLDRLESQVARLTRKLEELGGNSEDMEIHGP